MNKLKKAIKISITTIFIVAFIAMLGLSWIGAEQLVHKDLTQRRDYCSGDKQYCFADLLQKFNLSSKEIPVELTSFDGTKLSGSYFAGTNGAAIIVQHGYGGFRGRVLHIANMFYKQGFSVITMDLRAHGKSGGETVTFGENEAKDMQYVFDYLQTRPEINAEKIGLYGWSLGGATVLIHGDINPQVKAVVADSAYDAINYANMHEFTNAYWPMPYFLTLFTEYKSGADFQKSAPINHLQHYKQIPLMLLIPGSDSIVDAASGERLVTAMSGYNLEIWREPSFEHVRFSRNVPKVFAKKVGGFFSKHLNPN